MRLLHARHDHDGDRHREPQGRAPRRKRRSARSSRAISAAARAITTSSRRSRRRCAHGHGCSSRRAAVTGAPNKRKEDPMNASRHRRTASRASRTSASSPARAVHRRHQSSGPGLRRLRALAACPCPHQSVDRRRGRARLRPGVVALLHAARHLPTDKVGGLICGWMIHSKDGSPMKAGAASGARARTRCAMSATTSPWSSPRRWRRPRTRPNWSMSTTRCLPAVVDLPRRRAPASRRSMPAAPQHGLRVASRRQGRDRGGLRRAPSTSPSSTSSTTG